jgi:hypothetical protein
MNKIVKITNKHIYSIIGGNGNGNNQITITYESILGKLNHLYIIPQINHITNLNDFIVRTFLHREYTDPNQPVIEQDRTDLMYGINYNLDILNRLTNSIRTFIIIYNESVNSSNRDEHILRAFNEFYSIFDRNIGKVEYELLVKSGTLRTSHISQMRHLLTDFYDIIKNILKYYEVSQSPPNTRTLRYPISYYEKTFRFRINSEIEELTDVIKDFNNQL